MTFLGFPGPPGPKGATGATGAQGPAGTAYRQETHNAVNQQFNDSATHTLLTLAATGVPTGKVKVTWTLLLFCPGLGGQTAHVWIEAPSGTTISPGGTNNTILPVPPSATEQTTYTGSFVYQENTGGTINYLLRVSAAVASSIANYEYCQIVVEQ